MQKKRVYLPAEFAVREWEFDVMTSGSDVYLKDDNVADDVFEGVCL